MKEYTAQDYLRAIDSFAPFSLAESWDNTGLLIGSPEGAVSRAIIALDATSAVIEEAGKEGAQLVVTHHPVIFSGLKRIPAHSPVYQAIKSGVAVICAHTNLDVAEGGVNDILAGLLGLRDLAVLETTQTSPYRKVIVYTPADSAETVYSAMAKVGAGRQGHYEGAAFFSSGEGRFTPLKGANPAIGEIGKRQRLEECRIEMLVAPGDLQAVLEAIRQAHPYEEPAFDVLETHFNKERRGLGRVGSLPQPLSPEHFARYLKDRLGIESAKCVLGSRQIERVAVCGGAGASLLEQAKQMGAQALVSAEAKHSQMLEAADLGMTLIDAGHYATEAVVLPALLENLKTALPGAEIRIARSCADPGRCI